MSHVLYTSEEGNRSEPRTELVGRLESWDQCPLKTGRALRGWAVCPAHPTQRPFTNIRYLEGHFNN